MFTIRPPKTNGNGQNGNGHKNGNGNGNGNGHNGNGHSHKLETVLGPGVYYQGTLNGAGGVRIEGGFDGTINIKGQLSIAEGAKVTADVQAGMVTIAGNLKGNVTAEKVEILSTGRIWGDIVTSAFATEEGAFLRGQVTMRDETAPPPPEIQPALAGALAETA
jgi:cytoskeletal protein CcmA (bactofilin family)